MVTKNAVFMRAVAFRKRLGYNKYYEVTGEKMDIMCEGGTL